MKLIIGLGNPGKKYRLTRHNLGFLVVEEFANRNRIVLKLNRRLKAVVGQGVIFGQKISLAMPQTYMNLSGNSVKEILKYLKVEVKDILIICDDVNLAFGNLRLRPKGSSGGHNGLLSIIQTIQTQNFPRMRIGISNKEDIEDLSQFLLSNFTRPQFKKLKKIVNHTVDACEGWVKNGIVATMNEFNALKWRFSR